MATGEGSDLIFVASWDPVLLFEVLISFEDEAFSVLTLVSEGVEEEAPWAIEARFFCVQQKDKRGTKGEERYRRQRVSVS